MTPLDTCHHCERPLFEGVFCSRCRRWFDKFGSTPAESSVLPRAAAGLRTEDSGAVGAVRGSAAPPLHSDD